MKKILLSLSLIVFISLNSCKKEEKTETTTEPESTEVAVTENSLGNYLVDTAASSIKWTGTKPTGKHTGTIALKEGGFTVTDGKIENGIFTVDMTSITVTDLEGDDKAKLEGHLKGLGGKESEDHFFNTTKFPTSEFKIVGVENANGAYFVKGILTMKGISKPVEFPAEITITDTDVTLHSDPFKINRTLWGVNYASKSVFDDLKDKFVDDDIELEVNVKATKK